MKPKPITPQHIIELITRSESPRQLSAVLDLLIVMQEENFQFISEGYYTAVLRPAIARKIKSEEKNWRITFTNLPEMWH